MSDYGFDPVALVAGLLVPLQILCIDLLLSADNALVIALASRGLPPEETRRAALLGTLGAICLRIAMGSAALVLLRTPYLHIVAALALLYIAVQLTLERDDNDTRAALRSQSESDGDGRSDRRRNALAAVGAIIVADATMSFDNVIAVAAVAHDSLVFLTLGLAMSIPMLVWGSALIRTLLDKHGYLVRLSGAFLGWIAGSIAMSDPMLVGSIDVDAPALPFTVPAACAIFVVWQGLILAPSQPQPGGEHAERT